MLELKDMAGIAVALFIAWIVLCGAMLWLSVIYTIGCKFIRRIK